MEFISVQQAAANFGVTVRTVQKWAKEGKIKGAMRVGKVWLIPQNAVHPYESKNVAVGHKEWLRNTNRFEHLPFRLICADFAPGKSLDYIEAIDDTKIKNFSEAEYHFFKGNSERCIEIVEKYISDSDDTIAICSGLMYAVANLSIGNYRVARMTFDNMSKYMSTKEFAERDIKNESMTFFVSLIIDILIHSTKADIVKLREIMQYLPDGMRLFGAYLMAILAYINGDYSRVVGIADTAISLCPYVHMVPMIYLHIIAAIGLIIFGSINFTKAFIKDKLAFTSMGDYKIMMELQRLGVSYDIIEDNISLIDEDLLEEKIRKYIEKDIRTNKKYSGTMLKNKIYYHLVSSGYSKDRVISILNNYNF